MSHLHHQHLLVHTELKYKMKHNNILNLAAFVVLSLAISCNGGTPSGNDTAVKPLYVSDPVDFDTDDPAIWVNPNDPAQSLVIGTDRKSVV